MGMSTREWVRFISEDLGVGLPPIDVASVVIERQNAGRSGWPSSQPVLTDAVLDSAEIEPFIRVTMSAEQVEHGSPPSDVDVAVPPGLDVSTRQCVAVEDSSNGLRSECGGNSHHRDPPSTRSAERGRTRAGRGRAPYPPR
ncbi:MAG: hypothetical protein Q8Q02_13695 [Nocardioides sp.]|nr:hypothetical protein [Nocardioides sp.]